MGITDKLAMLFDVRDGVGCTGRMRVPTDSRSKLPQEPRPMPTGSAEAFEAELMILSPIGAPALDSDFKRCHGSASLVLSAISISAAGLIITKHC